MTLNCDLCVARWSHGYLVRVEGKGTSTHSPTLFDFVTGCLSDEPNSDVVVDLMECDYLDSTFLGCLLKLQRRGGPERFRVAADDKSRKKLLTATHLDRFLTVIVKAPSPQSSFMIINPSKRSKRELGVHMMETHAALGELPCDSAMVFNRIATQLRKDLASDDHDAK